MITDRQTAINYCFSVVLPGVAQSREENRLMSYLLLDYADIVIPSAGIFTPAESDQICNYINTSLIFHPSRKIQKHKKKSIKSIQLHPGRYPMFVCSSKDFN